MRQSTRPPIVMIAVSCLVTSMDKKDFKLDANEKSELCLDFAKKLSSALKMYRYAEVD